MAQTRPQIFKSNGFATFQKRLNEEWPQHALTYSKILKSKGFATDIYQTWLNKARPRHALMYSNVIDSLRTWIKIVLIKYEPSTPSYIKKLSIRYAHLSKMAWQKHGLNTPSYNQKWSMRYGHLSTNTYQSTAQPRPHIFKSHQFVTDIHQQWLNNVRSQKALI